VQRNAVSRGSRKCRAAIHPVVRSARRRFPSHIAGTDSAPRASLTASRVHHGATREPTRGKARSAPTNPSPRPDEDGP
jgi:hypothetical protein